MSTDIFQLIPITRFLDTSLLQTIIMPATFKNRNPYTIDHNLLLGRFRLKDYFTASQTACACGPQIDICGVDWRAYGS